MSLTPGHRAELHASGLVDETIARAGCYSATEAGVRDVLGYGAGAGLVFPYVSLNGGASYCRVKLDRTPPDGKRYRAPKGGGNRLYIPALLDPRILTDPAEPLWIPEGEKKGLKGCQEGLPCVAVSGVWSWKTRDADDRSVPLADLDLIVWVGRTVYLIFDSDRAQNPRVRAAERALAMELQRRGARVWIVPLPPGPDGAKQGLDDYLCTHSVEALCAITPIAPDAAAPDAGAAPARTPVLVCLGDVAPEPVEWLWPNRIARGKLALVIGEPGVGKTYATLDASARLTVSAAWPDGGRAPDGAVLLLASEDGLADTVRPIVDRQDGNARRVHVLQAVRLAGQDQDHPFSLEQDLPALEVAIQETHAVLVVISPLTAYLGTKDSYKDAEIRGLLTPLAALAERRRVAVVGIMHLTKAQTRRFLLRAQGSVAFVAQARTVLVGGVDPTTPERFLLAAAKNNLGPLAPALAYRITDAGLAWEPGVLDGTADTLLAMDEPVSRDLRRERDQAVTFLRDTLADGPMAATQILKDAKGNGIAERTLWRAKAELGVLAEREGGRSGAWYWMLPRGAA